MTETDRRRGYVKRGFVPRLFPPLHRLSANERNDCLCHISMSEIHHLRHLSDLVRQKSDETDPNSDTDHAPATRSPIPPEADFAILSGSRLSDRFSSRCDTEIIQRVELGP
jgi:hypothetical protein